MDKNVTAAIIQSVRVIDLKYSSLYRMKFGSFGLYGGIGPVQCLFMYRSWHRLMIAIPMANPVSLKAYTHPPIIPRASKLATYIIY